MDGRGTPGVLVVTDIPCSSTARSRDCRVFGTFTSDDGRTTLDRVKLAGAPVDVFAGRRIKVQRLASDSDVVYPSFYSHSWTTDAVLVGISLLVLAWWLLNLRAWWKGRPTLWARVRPWSP